MEDVVGVYLYEDGRIAFVVRTDNLYPAPSLNVRWVMADVANALQTLHRVRQFTEKPTASYALLVELRYDDQGAESIEPVRLGEWRLCQIDDETGLTGPMVSSDPISIGPVAVGGSETFPDVLKSVYTGIVTSANRRPDPDLIFDLAVVPEKPA